MSEVGQSFEAEFFETGRDINLLPAEDFVTP